MYTICCNLLCRPMFSEVISSLKCGEKMSGKRQTYAVKNHGINCFLPSVAAYRLGFCAGNVTAYKKYSDVVT